MDMVDHMNGKIVIARSVKCHELEYTVKVTRSGLVIHISPKVDCHRYGEIVSAVIEKYCDDKGE